MPPLSIEEGENSKQVGYQAPWDEDAARTSVYTSSLYQAGGSIFWIKANADGSSAVPAPVPSWSQCLSCVDMYFTRTKGALRKDGRILFPEIIEAYIEEREQIDFEWNSTLPILGGHALIQGWWIAMAKALLVKDVEHVCKLLQCGLSCTILVRVETSPALLVARSCQYSESLKSKVGFCSSTFLNFADKLTKVGVQLVGKNLQNFVDHRAKILILLWWW